MPSVQPRPGAEASRKKTQDRIYHLRVTLMEIVPRIWRQFCVPGNMKLSELHETLQVVMGWDSFHLHSFKIDGSEYGNGPGSCLEDPTIAEVVPPFKAARGRQVASRRIGKIRTVFHYEYDFGDSWQHEIRVEKVGKPNPKVTYPRCLDGERAAPPEDCGGPPGYEALLDEVRSRRIGRDEEAGEDDEDSWTSRFKPERFDVDWINARLSSKEYVGTIDWHDQPEEPVIPTIEECKTLKDRVLRACALIRAALVDRDIEAIDKAQYAVSRILVDDMITPLGLLERVEPPTAQAALNEMRSKELATAWEELRPLVQQFQELVNRVVGRSRKRPSQPGTRRRGSRAGK